MMVSQNLLFALMMAVMMMVMLVMMMLYGLRMKKAVMKLRMNLFLLLIPTVWQLFKLKLKVIFGVHLILPL